MTLPMLIEITEYWDVTPPLAESIRDIRLMLGGAPQRRQAPTPASSDADPQDHNALVADLAAMGFALPPGL